MNKLLISVVGIILFLFISVNIISALSPSITEAIQGLPFGDQLTLLAQRVDENTAKIDENTTKTQQLEQDLNTTNQELEAEKAKNISNQAQVAQENAAIQKRLYCEELKKKTPDRGNVAYINRDIVKYYEDVTQNLERVKLKPTRENDPEDAAAELKFYTEVVAEAKPMYDKYMTECGN